MKRRDLLRKLSADGFVRVRTKGPHDVFGRGTLRIAVPAHRTVHLRDGRVEGISDR